MSTPEPLPEFVFRPVAEFAAVDEPGADPLATSTDGGVVIPAGGVVLVYGTGGAGKTTLVLDLCFALAADSASWLDVVAAARALRIFVVENEGPRPEFRRKLRTKLTETGRTLGDGVVCLEEPWAALSLSSDLHRRALALALVEHETDLLVLGPLVSAGEFPNGGTPDEIRHFEQHVADLRGLVERPFAILLVHHENRAGQISGAWERFPDTIAHVTPQGNGRTRLFWQKARWSSALHGTSTQLVWADAGETFTVEDKPEITEDVMIDGLLAAVAAMPGGSWTKIREYKIDGEQVARGNGTELAALRDRLISDGILINNATRKGGFALWLADDPAIRSGAGTDRERKPFPPPASETDPNRSPFPTYRGNGNGNGTDEPEPDEIERLAAIAEDLEHGGAA